MLKNLETRAINKGIRKLGKEKDYREYAIKTGELLKKTIALMHKVGGLNYENKFDNLNARSTSIMIGDIDRNSAIVCYDFYLIDSISQQAAKSDFGEFKPVYDQKEITFEKYKEICERIFSKFTIKNNMKRFRKRKSNNVLVVFAKTLFKVSLVFACVLLIIVIQHFFIESQNHDKSENIVSQHETENQNQAEDIISQVGGAEIKLDKVELLSEAERQSEDYRFAESNTNGFNIIAEYHDNKIYITFQNNSFRSVKVGKNKEYSIKAYIDKNIFTVKQDSFTLASNESHKTTVDFEGKNIPSSIIISSISFENKGKYSHFVNKRAYFKKADQIDLSKYNASESNKTTDSEIEYIINDLLEARDRNKTSDIDPLIAFFQTLDNMSEQNLVKDSSSELFLISAGRLMNEIEDSSFRSRSEFEKVCEKVLRDSFGRNENINKVIDIYNQNLKVLENTTYISNVDQRNKQNQDNTVEINRRRKHNNESNEQQIRQEEQRRNQEEQRRFQEQQFRDQQQQQQWQEQQQQQWQQQQEQQFQQQQWQFQQQQFNNMGMPGF